MFETIAIRFVVTIRPMARKLAKQDVIILFVLSLIALFMGTLMWHVAVLASASREVDSGTLSVFLGIARWWANYVHPINLVVVVFSTILFGLVLNLNWANPISRATFGLWTVAWLFQFARMVFELLHLDVYCVYLDAACSAGILGGCLYARGRWNKYSRWFLLFPAMGALLSPLTLYWPSSLVNYFIFTYFAVTLLGRLERTQSQLIACLRVTLFMLLYNYYSLL